MRTTIQPLPFRRVLVTLVLVGTAACASAGAPAVETAAPPPAPRAEPAEQPELDTDPFAPPAPALRAAETMEWTGEEFGTMWTFENPPLEYWRERYGFTPDQAWLDHARLASVRYSNFCSASFVSPRGLTMTNNHCARECVEAVSTAEADYVVEGFYAASPAEELVCPDLYVEQLVDIEDVTQRVRAASPAAGEAVDVSRAREAEQSAIEAECETEWPEDHVCEVVALYFGGQFQLYVYRRYEPVKLVFAPELQAGSFGGDPDNFTYPRYALDVSFVRAYGDDGRPAATPEHFEWDRDGADVGELVLITGNPGSTSRLFTVSQVLFARAYSHPFLAGYFEGMVGMLRDLAERGPDEERAVREELHSLENALKLYRGQLAGLQDTLLLARKLAGEREFRDSIAADPELQREFGGVFDELQDIQRAKAEIYRPLYVANPGIASSPLQEVAGALWLHSVLSRIPETQRPPQFRGEGWESLRAEILAESAELDLARETATLALRLELASRWLADRPDLLGRLLRQGETPEAAAERIIRETRLTQPAWRRQVVEDQVDPTADPLFRTGEALIEIYRELVPRWQELVAREEVQQERLARALFAVYGTDLPPDATLTLRISDGVVRGYPMNGTFAPPYTSIYGLYGRAFDFGNEMPWKLPDTFAERRGEVDMATRYNFVTTNDITGGNSGSPMIDRHGRIVGIAFDGNIEGLPNEFLFDDTAGRTIGVHSAGILEALRSVYRTDALLEELLGEVR